MTSDAIRTTYWIDRGHAYRLVEEFTSSIDRYKSETLAWPSEPMRYYSYEPMPPRVTYEAARNRKVYTPENILPGTTTRSPSDCVWWVPGSAGR